MSSLTITKIEAARRQLETAVLLYFNDRDTLAIHTLAAAAQGVLNTLVKRAGKTSALHDSLFALLPPELANQARDAIRGPQNFLKHSDRDPDGTLELSPDLTEVILCDAVASYTRLTGDLPPHLNAFVMWLNVSHPTWFSAPGPPISQEDRSRLAAEGRASFLESYLVRNYRLRP